MNYCHFKIFGCSKGCFAYCNMINAGHMTREEALRQEEELSARRMEGLDDLLSSGVGLKAREVQRFLSLGA